MADFDELLPEINFTFYPKTDFTGDLATKFLRNDLAILERSVITERGDYRNLFYAFSTKFGRNKS